MEDNAETHDVPWLVHDLRGKQIRCRDGPVGQAVDVLVDPVTERPSHLVWRETVVVTKEVSIPIGYIARVERDRIILGVEREAVERLPRFWTTDSTADVEVSEVKGY